MMKQENKKKIHVLWVRHCISCSNVADEEKDKERRYKIEPLCTPDGIMHTIVSGDRISNFIKKNFNLATLDIEFFCSFLPRAMETAKLISSELIDHGLISSTDRKKIRRIPFVSELWSSFETKVKIKGTAFEEEENGEEDEGVYSTSTTTRERSDIHAKFINAILSQTGLQIDIEDEEGFLNYEEECTIVQKKRRCKLDLKKGYKKFLMNFIMMENSAFVPSKNTNRLNIIVSHGAFMEKYIVLPPPSRSNQKGSFYVDNVDAIFVEYEKEKEKLEGEEDEETSGLQQTLVFYLKSPDATMIKDDRRLLLKLNSHEIRKLLNSDFGRCNYTFKQIKTFGAY